MTDQPTKADLDELMHRDPNDLVKDGEARAALVEGLRAKRAAFVAKEKSPAKKAQKKELPVELDLDLDL